MLSIKTHYLLLNQKDQLMLVSNGLVAIKMMVKEISAADQRDMDSNPTLVEQLVKTINTLLFRIMVGVLVTTLSVLPRSRILKCLITNVT